MAGYERPVNLAELEEHWQPYLGSLTVTSYLVEHVKAVGACAEFGKPGSRLAAEELALARAVLVQDRQAS